MNQRWVQIAAGLGAFLAIFGGRLVIANALGVDMPFWDQWGAEGGMVYLPYRAGTLTVLQLFVAHNEHYIVLPRLLDLLLFALNGGWDVRLQLTANAASFAAAWAILALALGRCLGTGVRLLLLAASVVLAILPFGWENLLAGFQSCFFLALLLQWPALWLLVTRPPLSRAWWAGALLSALAFLSLASGFGAALVGGGFATFLAVTDPRQRPRAIVAALLLGTLSAACIAVTPRAAVPTAGLSAFAIALGQLLAWPFVGGAWPALLVQAPWVASTIGWLRAPRGDRSFAVALGAWIWLQTAIVAYGRGGVEGEPASRYLDLVVPGLLLGGACAARALRDTHGSPRRLVGVGVAAWLLLVGVGVARAVPTAWRQAVERSTTLRVEADHVRAFLRSDDDRVLLDAPFLAIPVPNEIASRLVLRLRNPDFVALLPSALRGRPDQPLLPLSAVSEALLARGAWLAAIGLLLLGSMAVRAMLPREPGPQGEAR